MSDLPNGWTLVRVGEVVALNPKNNAAEQTQAGFSPMHLLGTGFRSSVGFEPKPWLEIRKNYTHFADGDVLLAKITPCFENGKAGLVANMPNGIGAGSSEYFVCRPKAGALDAKYLLAHFKTDAFLKSGAVRMTGSVGHKRVPKEYLLGSELPLAPIGEQKRITDKLDAVLARVDACRDHLDRVLAILKRFRQSVLVAATSGALTVEWQAEFGAASWPTKCLGELTLEIKNGLSPKPVEQPPGTPILRISAVRPFVVRQDDLRFLPDSGNTSAYELRVGDLLFTRYNGSLEFVGVCARVRTVKAPKLVYPDKLIRVRVDASKVLSSWIEIAVNSPSIRDIIERTARTSAGQTGISGKDLKGLKIPVPSLAEQAEIVRRVESLFGWADRLEVRHATARAHVERLTPALLAKAFRGELVPQDPADEPASELLERLGQRPADNSTGLPKSQGAKPRRANAAQTASSA
ncbi:MAG: restriction endonuclease subunit S [Burkholderiaceae bacterium]|nr:restriction endonuclease subunit S [Burkholderiaceae bacterium]